MNKNGENAGADPGRIAYLIDGFLRNSLTETEHDELDAWIETSPENMRLFEELTDEENLQAAQAWFAAKDANKRNKNIRFREIRERTRGGGVRAMTWYLAAASIIGLSLGIYWFATKKSDSRDLNLAQQVDRRGEQAQQGVLILADGRKIPLGETVNKEQGFTIEKGTITYTDMASLDTGYNTVMVPFGKQFKIVLADGTTVWLNAGTTARYPAAFGKRSRSMILTGEAFFDVQHDPSKPFTVSSDKQEVIVLGTQFNVSAYNNEAPITTLVKGSVKIAARDQSKILQPGQQSKIGVDGIRITPVEVEEITAWKEGVFLFRSAPIESVAAQLQRWYDLQIEYRKKPKEHFNATINRTESLERVLQILEGSGYVHFKLEGKKLVIQP